MCILYVRINVLLPKYPLHDVAGITVTHCGMYSPEVRKSLFCIAEKPVSRHGRASFAVRNDVFYNIKYSNRLYARVLYKMQNTRVFAAGWSRARSDGSIAGLPLHIYAYAAGIMYIYANTLMRA